jgi:hypothetical protein
LPALLFASSSRCEGNDFKFKVGVDFIGEIPIEEEVLVGEIPIEVFVGEIASGSCMMIQHTI